MMLAVVVVPSTRSSFQSNERVSIPQLYARWYHLGRHHHRKCGRDERSRLRSRFIIEIDGEPDQIAKIKRSGAQACRTLRTIFTASSTCARETSKWATARI